jgi:hypothetical protein
MAARSAAATAVPPDAANHRCPLHVCRCTAHRAPPRLCGTTHTAKRGAAPPNDQGGVYHRSERAWNGGRRSATRAEALDRNERCCSASDRQCGVSRAQPASRRASSAKSSLASRATAARRGARRAAGRPVSACSLASAPLRVSSSRVLGPARASPPATEFHGGAARPAKRAVGHRPT